MLAERTGVSQMMLEQLLGEQANLFGQVERHACSWLLNLSLNLKARINYAHDGNETISTR